MYKSILLRNNRRIRTNCHKDSCLKGDVIPPPMYGVVVVYNVTIVAIGHGLLKKFWPLVVGCVLRTAGSSII